MDDCLGGKKGIRALYGSPCIAVVVEVKMWFFYRTWPGTVKAIEQFCSGDAKLRPTGKGLLRTVRLVSM